MTIKHHLDPATLTSFAAGSLPEALAAVAAGHVAFCPQCARDVRRMEHVGAAMLAALEPKRLLKPLPEQAARRAEAGPDAATQPPTANSGLPGLPAAVTRIIGCQLDAVEWKRLGVGIWHAKLPVSDAAEGDLHLIKVAPGRKLPEHGHGGSELTLLLDGSYSDELGEFRIGDVADLDTEIEHQPIADAETGCICLIAFERPARFKGLMSRLVQPLTGM